MFGDRFCAIQTRLDTDWHDHWIPIHISLKNNHCNMQNADIGVWIVYPVINEAILFYNEFSENYN